MVAKVLGGSQKNRIVILVIKQYLLLCIAIRNVKIILTCITLQVIVERAIHIFVRRQFQQFPKIYYFFFIHCQFVQFSFKSVNLNVTITNNIESIIKIPFISSGWKYFEFVMAISYKKEENKNSIWEIFVTYASLLRFPLCLNLPVCLSNLIPRIVGKTKNQMALAQIITDPPPTNSSVYPFFVFFCTI